MSEQEHTKLPWKFGRTGEPVMIVGGERDAYVAHVRIHQIGGGAIAGAMEEERQANAEFIVRACNSFDDLLEAFKRRVSECPCQGGVCDECDFDRELIKKATPPSLDS